MIINKQKNNTILFSIALVLITATLGFICFFDKEIKELEIIIAFSFFISVILISIGLFLFKNSIIYNILLSFILIGSTSLIFIEIIKYNKVNGLIFFYALLYIILLLATNIKRFLFNLLILISFISLVILDIVVNKSLINSLVILYLCIFYFLSVLIVSNKVNFQINQVSFFNSLEKVNHEKDLEIENLKIELNKIQKESLIDNITDLSNLKYLENEFDLIIKNKSKNDYPLCLSYVQIMDFSDLVSQYGHQDTNKFLYQVGTLIKENTITNNGFPAHLGNGNFVILFKGVSKIKVNEYIQFLEQTITKTYFATIKYTKPTVITTTTSIIDSNNLNFDELLDISFKNIFESIQLKNKKRK